MARFSESEIERLKSSISLVALLQQQGFELKKQGKDYLCRCPFHDDKTPSLVVSPDKNLWNCLGVCGTGGTVIDWMMQLEKVGFRTAVEMLLEQIPSLAAAPVKQTKAKPQVDILLPEAQALLQKTVNLYHQNLLNNTNGLAYLETRGLNHPELINTFKLGYCTKNISEILPTRTCAEGKEQRELAKQIGITSERGIERFSGSIVAPVINDSQVLEIYGRKTAKTNKLRKGTPIHLYLPGAHQGVWNLEGLAKKETVILCESVIDAMTCWVHGFKNVTYSYGVNGFTEAHINAFKAAGIKRVLIAYDRDEAGDKAAASLAELLIENDLAPWRVKLPPGLDLNEFALQAQNSKDALDQILLQAQSLQVEPVVATSSKAPEKTDKDIQVLDNEVHINLGSRHYRIRGLKKNTSPEQLKINLMCEVDGAFHVDSLDLYHAKQRHQFIEHAKSECDIEARVIKSDLGKVLLKLEALQEESEPQKADEEITLTDSEKDEALALLQSPDLLNRILIDFDECGVVGEETNKLVGYLACVSRKLDKPLAIIIQSSSAAGKSSLMDAILKMVPAEECTQFSAMTGQSLFYMSDSSLKHKILAISEEEGATQAAYALKLLQSQGELTMASTGKDSVTGQLVTQEYKVEGPVMLFLTTTAIDIDEELLNRCLVLTVNESQEQTKRIHELQRKRRTLDGLLQKVSENKLVTLHQNAQRLLRPLYVVNPFAESLTFLDNQTRTRRDHEKYLTLIESIALLHQYQREIKTLNHNGAIIEYIEVTQSDIEQANRLAHETLGRTLDELPPQTRKLLTLIHQMVLATGKNQQLEQTDIRFSRRDIREASGWGLTQVATHCQRLEKMEYLICRNGQRGQVMQYELKYQGEGHNGSAFMLGLLDIKSDINKQVDGQLSGLTESLPASNRGQIGRLSGSNRTEQINIKPNGHKVLSETKIQIPKNEHPAEEQLTINL
jgi:DNA primase catalytic core